MGPETPAPACALSHPAPKRTGKARFGSPAPMRPRFWLSLAYQPVAQLVDLARAAEDAGFHGVALPEHLVTPAKITSRYPYREDGVLDVRPELQAPDPWVAIGTLAGATRTLRFVTSVYLLPLHELFSAAKAISTAACLSGGRVALGVGVGWMREEFELTGQDFATRGRRTDEMLAAMRRLFAGGMVEHHGEFFDFDPVQISPVPEAPIPVYVGGESPAALRRAAAADGWMSARICSPGELADVIGRLNAARAIAGAVERPLRIFASADQPPAPDVVEAMSQAGVTDLTISARHALGPWHASAADKRRSLHAFATRFRLRAPETGSE
ncbi:MAG: TIGR03619 family F420-dependent LLM class oxidoreductase [Gammaproteobacteria bacterium]